MTYCAAIHVSEGLVFISDSRTSAGVDDVRTYGKMHTFSGGDERCLVILSAGNLATSQAVLAKVRRDNLAEGDSILRHAEIEASADYLGQLLRAQNERHGDAVSQSGSSVDASLIVGGQISGRAPEIYLVYPQGNYITTSSTTRYLQLGEAKYGRPILDRIVGADTSLDDAAICALVSMDSTLRSNVSVGPPVEILKYREGSLSLDDYVCLQESDPRLARVRDEWNERMREAFRGMSGITWAELPPKPRFR